MDFQCVSKNPGIDIRQDSNKNYLHLIASQPKLSRDMMFGIQNYTWANKQSGFKNSKVYVYRFARKLPATGDYIKYGTFHTGEVAYAYGNLNFVHLCPWEPGDFALEKTMSSYWANFIKTGNPNGKNLPKWVKYNSINNDAMILDIYPQVKQLPDKNVLDFLILEIKKKEK